VRDNAGRAKRRVADVEHLRRSPFTAYAVAVLCAALSVLVRTALDPVWGLKLPLLTFFSAVAVAA